ncbi:hypothetical protein QBC35DRAFT_420039 [Podospora australis]|uniref:DUF7580 domain-containing protein n=1 Tax=Podospora australis TaxID=1536484 RepID=A0AAN6WJB1_9PEZI|nr:hypothetical protein QBC35DRAFT_420039 [Podospora australis]
MSGFEAAGVVLGSLPIIVSALQLYVKGASTIHKLRFATKELKSLIRNLQTEQIKLQNVYEKLLADIVPESQIETMINHPFGPLWSAPETAARIKRRLYRSSELFKGIVEDMNDAIDEIKQKLNIGPDGTVEWMKLSGVKKEYKRALFVLQRSEYNDALSRLKDGVSSLEDLLKLNMELEPDRRRRSQGKVYKLLRDASASIYHALRSAMTCQCPGLHDFGLKLLSRPVTHITCHDDDYEEILEGFRFSLSVSSASSGFETQGADWGSVKLWSMLSLSLQSRRNKQPQKQCGVRFSVPNGPQTLAYSQNIGMTPIQTQARHIDNLCHSIHEARKQLDGECCGCILDSSLPSPRTYQVFPLGSPNDSGNWDLVPLRAVLSGEIEVVPPLLYGDKLWLAWTIASSVAQLRGTYWYLNPPTHNDLFLARQDGAIHFRDVFVVRRFPDSSLQHTTPLHTRNIHPTLVALGVLLIEVIYGQTIEKVRPQEGNLHTILSSYEAVTQLLSTVNTLGGPNYYKAVRRCIKCEVFDTDSVGMGDDPVQKDVFVGVLALIEQDLELAMS